MGNSPLYFQKEKVKDRRSRKDRRVADDNLLIGTDGRSYIERRKGARERGIPRFRVKDLTFVKLNSIYKEDVGQLLDISKKGLSIRYFANEEKSWDYSELGIFLSGGDFILEQIPFRTVSDTVLNNNSMLSPFILRRYGVQFDELTSVQKERLDYFLLNHTESETLW